MPGRTDWASARRFDVGGLVSLRHALRPHKQEVQAADFWSNADARAKLSAALNASKDRK